MNSFARLAVLGGRYLTGCTWLSDARTLKKLCRLDPLDVLFFCTSNVDEQWFRTTLAECRRRGISCSSVLVTMNPPSTPVFRQLDHCISPIGLRRIECSMAVTSSTGIPGWCFPQTAHWRVHIPHSLASLHAMYVPGTFDGFNAFFCCGEHHRREVARMDELSAREPRKCWPMGYGKMDLMRARHMSSSQREGGVNACPIVLLAPSWGPGNVLETVGSELVKSLIDAGYHVVLRPHPILVSDHPELLAAIEDQAKPRERFSIESPHEESSALHCADVMISDYSGVAYEYAFLRERPVVFVDGPPKQFNPNWRQYNLEPMEVALREEVGFLTSADCNEIVSTVGKALVEADSRRVAIQRVRSTHLFNPEDYATPATDVIAEMICCAG